MVSIITLVFFLAMFLTLGYFSLVAWRFLTKKPDFEQLEHNGAVEQLIQTLLDEINTALSLNETEVIHKFNPAEPPIDGEVAAEVTFKVAMVVPCIILFRYQDNGDVNISLQRMTQGN